MFISQKANDELSLTFESMGCHVSGCFHIAAVVKYLKPHNMITTITELSQETGHHILYQLQQKPWESLRCDLPDSSTLAQHPINTKLSHVNPALG